MDARNSPGLGVAVIDLDDDDEICLRNLGI